jgi:hypothetical protein
MAIDEEPVKLIYPRPPDHAPPPHKASDANPAVHRVTEAVADGAAEGVADIVVDGIFDAICDIVVGVFKD